MSFLHISYALFLKENEQANTLFLVKNAQLIQTNDAKEAYSLFLRVRDKMEKEGNDTWSDDYPNREIFEDDAKSGALFLYKIDGETYGSCALNSDFVSYFFPKSQDKNKAESFLAKYHIDTSFRPFLLERFMVDPYEQNQGIGSDFLKKILLKEADRDCLAVAYKKNEKAISFYKNRGFLLLGDCSDAEWGNDGASCLLFIKKHEER